MDMTDFVLSKIREGPTLAKRYTMENGKELPKRRIYSFLENKVEQHLRNPKERLLVLSGLRGVGKTTVLFQLYNHLLDKDEVNKEDVLYISADEITSFTDSDLSEVIRTYVENIHETSLAELDKKIFLLIDEAHFDKNWSKTAKIVYDKNKNIFMLLTGSSALDLSMKTDTARRSKENHMFPLNFAEYLIMKHSIYPPKGTSKSIRNLIFRGDEKSNEEAKEKELKLKKKLTDLKRPPEIEFKKFVLYGGFAYTLNLDKDEVLERTRDVIERVVEKDIMLIKPFNQKSIPKINKTLSFLALQKPGSTSHTKLANHLDTSADQIGKIMEVLTKSQIIFPIIPYGGAGKSIRKPKKYYFLTPTLKASLCHTMGKLDENNREKYGEFIENLVASHFHRMSKTVNYPQKIYYDTKDGGADLILKKGDKEIVLEVGIGKKNTGQVKKTMERTGADHGIIVSEEKGIHRKNDVIFLPIKTFAFT